MARSDRGRAENSMWWSGEVAGVAVCWLVSWLEVESCVDGLWLDDGG